MYLKQYYLGCLAHASYLIADERTKEALVVDPQRDVEQYLADAAEHGFQIKYVALTHFHADFLAGHIELRNRAGARIVIGARARAEFEFLAAKENDELRLGDVRVRILETPGHTPEGISLLVFAGEGPEESPRAVLTGDTLFIGDVGRPDLLASIGVTADELAEMLYESLNKLRALPPSTLVYPAHGAGSMCGKNLSAETVSTIGEQLRTNYALQPMSFEEFKRVVTADQPAAPDYFVYDAIKNRQERPGLEMTLPTALQSLDADEVAARAGRGAQIVDVREAAEFEAAHFVGAINIGLKGKYATWCGTVLSHERPIIVVAEPGSEEEAIMRLGRIGFDNVVGFLRDGMEALRSRPDLVRQIPRISAREIAERLSDPDAPFVLDVRTEREWRGARLSGSVNIPLAQLRERLSEVPVDRPIVIHCEGGYRSAVGASLLTGAGRTEVTDLVDGIKAWIASGLPTESDGLEVTACAASCRS
ncbi:MAG TPA: MBL fold metallo-hydrolase [Pirellulaceae bacterium]|nr:MBL fold metallo-hydrolase [Pirellulaceae bacterium]